MYFLSLYFYDLWVYQNVIHMALLQFPSWKSIDRSNPKSDWKHHHSSRVVSSFNPQLFVSHFGFWMSWCMYVEDWCYCFDCLGFWKWIISLEIYLQNLGIWPTYQDCKTPRWIVSSCNGLGIQETFLMVFFLSESLLFVCCNAIQTSYLQQLFWGATTFTG